MFRRHGILLRKETAKRELPLCTVLADPATVTVRLRQAGTTESACPVVQQGDHVAMGQLIARGATDLDAALHSPIAGTVTGIFYDYEAPGKVSYAIDIENDFSNEFASPIPFDKPWVESTVEELIAKIDLAGIIECGDRPIALHTKFRQLSSQKISVLVVNALETEPTATGVHALLAHETEAVLTGALIAQKITGAEHVVIAINKNFVALQEVLTTCFQSDPFQRFSLVKLVPYYPCHSDTLLLQSLLGQKTFRALKTNVLSEVFVLSVPSAKALRDAVCECKPWYESVVSVGDKNFVAKIGTPVQTLFDAAGIDTTNATTIVHGASMLGRTALSLTSPIDKATTALNVYTTLQKISDADDCIRCGRCEAICPHSLPVRALAHLSSEEFSTHIPELDACIMCGLCCFVCPAKIPLTTMIRSGQNRQSLCARGGHS